jgi:hypothetical protein
MSDDLDLAIDRAVREMLDIEPPMALRANVIARIENGSPFPVSSFQFPVSSWVRVGVVAVAAAVVVLAVMLARRSEPTVQPPTGLHAADVRLPFPGSSLPQTRPASQTDQTLAASQQARRAQASTVAAASVAGGAVAGADDTTAGIEPLKTITPIEVAPIGQASIAPEPIAVRPLNPIAEVQIAPLNPPDRRD